MSQESSVVGQKKLSLLFRNRFPREFVLVSIRGLISKIISELTVMECKWIVDLLSPTDMLSVRIIGGSTEEVFSTKKGKYV